MGNALRDYSYIRTRPALSTSDALDRKLTLKAHFPAIASLPGEPLDSHYAWTEPPHPSGQVDSIRRLLQRRLPLSLSYPSEEKRARPDEYRQGRPPQGISRTVDRTARFAVAFLGGAFLLVPMLVMVVTGAQSSAKSVATTCAAVLCFALALSVGFEAGNVETMISTATYTAVLVVFVGTNSAGGVGLGQG